MPNPTAFQLAILNGKSQEVMDLINQPEIKASLNNIDDQGKTPLILAVEANAPDIIEILVKNGANVNQAIKGSTALMIAAKFGKLEIAKTLILAKADVNKVVGFSKVTALKLAKQHLSPDLFQAMELAFKEAQADLGIKIKQPIENKNFSPTRSSQNKGIAGGNLIPRKTQGR